MPPPEPRILKVAFNAPARRMFDYLPPEDAPPRAAAQLVGRRVLAPLRGRDEVGVVLQAEMESAVPAARLLRIRKAFADMPPLSKAALDLVRFCSQYYCCPIGVAAFAAIPKPFRQNREFKTGQPPANTPPAAADNTVAADAAVADAKRKPSAPPPLTAEQKAALKSADADSGFAPHLVFGATGSGKTELYLHFIARALARGKQALMLAPEIHLTPQIESALRGRFPGRRVCVLHSAMPDRPRAENWLAAQSGSADIILGTRLAVFTPAPKLGVVIVDEEHDESFREAEQGLLFSARDLGVWRARRQGAAFFAGSATPSLESFHNALQEKYKIIRLRKPALPAARVSLELIPADNPRDGMTPEFMRALRESQAGEKSQALVFINRRGYAPALVCRECRAAVECRNCAARMTAHRRGAELRCHLCGKIARPPERCPACGAPALFSPAGHGTQRVEESLARAFPRAGVARLDRDSLARRGAFDAARRGIQSGQFRILVGTQIIAKGHDFPNLNFIGILNADAGLLSSDFRAQERMFALLTQALGRGTRNPAGCRALIQTRHPDHPFYAELRRGDVESCWSRILLERKKANLPPFSRLALLRAKSRDAAKLRAFLARARELAPRSGATICDPAPDFNPLVGGWHRAHILAQRPGKTRTAEAAFSGFLNEWAATLEKPKSGIQAAGIRWTVEVDPAGI